MNLEEKSLTFYRYLNGTNRETLVVKKPYPVIVDVCNVCVVIF